MLTWSDAFYGTGVCRPVCIFSLLVAPTGVRSKIIDKNTGTSKCGDFYVKAKHDFSGLQVPANRAHRGDIGNRRTEPDVCLCCVVRLGRGGGGEGPRFSVVQ